MESVLILYLCLFLSFSFVHGEDYFQLYEDMMNSEQGRQAGESLKRDIVADSPKEIEIICPETPMVHIRDMTDIQDSNSGECMVFKFTGPKFFLRLSVNCDSEEANVDVEFSHDDVDVDIEFESNEDESLLEDDDLDIDGATEDSSRYQ